MYLGAFVNVNCVYFLTSKQRYRLQANSVYLYDRVNNIDSIHCVTIKG